MKSEEDESRILRGRRKTGQALGPRERSVQRLAVRAMAGGRVPTVETLSHELGLPVDGVREALASLEACDCVVMDRDRVRVAYPFTTDLVPHEVVSSRGTARANCAVDALGAGAMLGEEVEIRSTCSYCGASIRLRGKESFRAATIGPVVFVPPSDLMQGHASDFVCPSINFYCNEEHGRAHAGTLAAGGRFLSLKEATALGISAFGDLLSPTSARSGERRPVTME